MLHGRLLGGLAARALERDVVDDGWRVARLTVDLFRPAAMAPVEISTSLIRSGRRIRVADVLVNCGGHLVARVTGLVLLASDEPPGRIWRPSPERWPDPETVGDDPADGSPDAWLVRTVEGGFGTGERTRVWTNDTGCLVDDEPLSPFVRAAVSADLACPMANSSDQGLHYINGDYTLSLARYPVGPWIGLEVAQQLAADGISLASSNLVDRDGPFAISTGSSLVTTPLDAGG